MNSRKKSFGTGKASNDFYRAGAAVLFLVLRGTSLGIMYVATPRCPRLRRFSERSMNMVSLVNFYILAALEYYKCA